MTDKGNTSNFAAVSPVDSGTILGQLAGRTELTIDASMVSPNYTGFKNFNFSLTINGKDALGKDFSAAATRTDQVGGYGEGRINSKPVTFTYNYSSVAGGSLTAGTAQSVQFVFKLSTAGTLNLNNDPAANDIAIDNLRVVPEPASMSILGLGGLMLLKRRRRMA